MELDWKCIKNGYKGFENLAVTFVNSMVETKSNKWEKTKDTHDKNHDAVRLCEKSDFWEKASLYIGYATDNDIWWMEAKYSGSNSGKISRYRMDTTIVSALSKNTVSKIVFVTNLDISSKAVSDIRKAIKNSSTCKEVRFYTKPQLEHWLLQDNYLIFKNYFNIPYKVYEKYTLPLWYCCEEITVYNCSDTMFESPLEILYTNFSYKIRFSIYANISLTANVIEATNIEIENIQSNKIVLTPGVNNLEYIVKIPATIEKEKITSKDIAGDATSNLPICLKLSLEKRQTLEINTLYDVFFINSDKYIINIPSQKKIEAKVVSDIEKNFYSPFPKFSFSVICGKSGIGKSFTIDRIIQSLLSLCNDIIIYKCVFSGEINADLRIIKENIFHLLFPFIQYNVLDKKYIEELKHKNMNYPPFFFDLTDPLQDVDAFIKTMDSENDAGAFFPNAIESKIVLLIFDEYHKLNKILKPALSKLFLCMKKLNYKVYCLLATQIFSKPLFPGTDLQKTANEFSLEITTEDIQTVLKAENINIDILRPDIIFSTAIELIYFIKYLKDTQSKISSLEDFEFLYHTYLNSDILKNELKNKFDRVFAQYPKAKSLCSYIYYSNPGLHYNDVQKEDVWKENIIYLLQTELVRKDDYEYYIPWHDYYREIYQNFYEFNSDSKFETEMRSLSNLKNSFELLHLDIFSIKEQLKLLFNKQRFYSLYYILENSFSSKAKRTIIKNLLLESDYYYLFGLFCYANTNVGTVFTGYDKFKEMYNEMRNVKTIYSKCIKYIILFELINSSYESGNFEEAKMYLKNFCLISERTRDNWENVYGWEYKVLVRSAISIQLLMEAEDGRDIAKEINELNDKNKYSEKDLAFIIYRLLLANLTNNYQYSVDILFKNNKFISETDVDSKTVYMYEFAISFFKCLKNEIDLSDVLTANNHLKNEYHHDYNRHIFAISALAFYKKETDILPAIFWEYINTKRKLKNRQAGFKEAILALLELERGNIQNAIAHLRKQAIYMSKYKTYLPIIEHNIKVIMSNVINILEQTDFYYGQDLRKEKYYLDIRMLY